MSEFLAGMTAMAALALCLRWWAAVPPLRAPLAALTGFVVVLAALFLTDLIDLSGWEACLLPLLPVLLARHMDALVSQPMRRWQPIAAMAGVLLLPYLTLPRAARQLFEAGEVPQIAPAQLLLVLASVVLFYLAFVAITAASGLQIWQALRRHKAQFAQVVAAPSSPRLDGVVILSLFLGFVFLGQLAGLLLAGAGFDLFGGVFGDLFPAIVVLGVTLHGLTLEPLLPDWADEVITPPLAPTAEHPAYARSGLDEATRTRLLSRLDIAMQKEALWREQMLTLKDLATAAGAKPFYVSQALNQGRGTSFFDYVNGWRVREACTLLRDTEQTVLDISEAVGFNAKSTFNAAFRKATGTTPSAWRACGPLGSVDPAQPE